MHLSREYGKGPVLISRIAESERIPQKFLELILLELKNHGFLRSKKGKGGGYFLARSPEEIPFGSVIRSLEGPLAPAPCVSQTAYHTCEECTDEAACGIRPVLKEVRDAIAGVLDRTSLKDAMDRARSEAAAGSVQRMYYI